VGEGAIIRNHRGIGRMGIMYKIGMIDYSVTGYCEEVGSNWRERRGRRGRNGEGNKREKKGEKWGRDRKVEQKGSSTLKLILNGNRS
jgi:hypothetical protein